MKFGLVPLEGGAPVELEVGCSGLHLGRGPLLRIDATNISRKHVFLVADIEDKNLCLSCLHRTPVTVLSRGVEKHLGINEKAELHHGDVIKFLPDKFHFGLEIRTDATAANIGTYGGASVAPKPRTVAQTPDKKQKKRELPHWMEKLENSAGKASAVVKKKEKENKENEIPAATMVDNPVKKKSPLKDSTRPAGAGGASGEQEPAGPSSTEKVKPFATVVPRDGAAAASRGDGAGRYTRISNLLAHAGDSVPPVNAPIEGQLEEVTGAVGRTDLSTESTASGATRFPTVITPADYMDTSDEEDSAKGKPPPTKKRRPCCQYGATCYRKNPAHRKDKSHPGDDDYVDNVGEGEEDDSRPECEYGLDCYRKNPVHRRHYRHTHKPQPKRGAKQAGARKKNKEEDDEYESDFIDDDEEEPVDDTDEDENWAPDDTDTD